MHQLAIESLTARGFRNLEPLEISLGPGFNVFAGDNGQGKTNLLEAVYLLATSRSFRTGRLLELVAHGQEAAAVRAAVVEEGIRREQSVGLRRGLRAARIDGKRPASLAAYAVNTPVVAFHPGSVTLSTGSGAERRRVLDRIALYREPGVLGAVEAYAKALRSRQRVLEQRGEHSRDLDDWEDLLVRHGQALRAHREAAAAELGPAVEAAFLAIGPEGSELAVRYAPGGPAGEEAFRAALVRDRARDQARRSASVGPHRDDLVLELNARPVRGVASQGQHRAVVLALHLAEIDVVARARSVRPILLLDDVSSELDRGRTDALLRALSNRSGQVLLTTTRPELMEIGRLREGSRRDFRVIAGQIAVA